MMESNLESNNLEPPEWLRKISARVDQMPAEQAEVLLQLYEDGLPTTATGIEAKNRQGKTIWITRSVAIKPYTCPCCRESIYFGDAHSLVRIQSGTKRYDRSHYHKHCSYFEINYTKEVVRFKNDLESVKKIKKRQARSRYRRKKLKGS